LVLFCLSGLALSANVSNRLLNYGNIHTSRKVELKQYCLYLFCLERTNFIGVVLFIRPSLKCKREQQTTKLLTKSLPSRLVSQLPSSGLLESVLLFRWLSVTKWQSSKFQNHWSNVLWVNIFC